MNERGTTLLAVPNISEGRILSLVETCARRAQMPGVRQLDLSSDADHNRSVLTLAGRPSALIDATVELAAATTELLTLDSHDGVHPRLGVLDVLPFVYLEPCDLVAARDAARRCAAAIADRLDLPVLLYDDASSPRRSLPELRRGGLRALAQRIQSGAIEPDFGPRVAHPSAGFVCVGARPPLVAFNLWLEPSTDSGQGTDLRVARQIAAAIRETSPSGLPGVRALGLRLPSQRVSQVSINLVDHVATSLPTLVRRVCGEAEARGARVSRSELIGLCPRGALDGAAADELLLPALDEHQIIESHL